MARAEATTRTRAGLDTPDMSHMAEAVAEVPTARVGRDRAARPTSSGENGPNFGRMTFNKKAYNNTKK